MTQKERQERSKNEIFQAALEEFGNYDYHAVTMESICAKHGISKGMMYHYYSSKDELFLLCVQKTFEALKLYIEETVPRLSGENTLQTVQNYFMSREYFFELHPREKRIFEGAMLHPPKHLAESIYELRGPIRKMNRDFLETLVASMTLRPELSAEKAAWYLESLEYIFQPLLIQYQSRKEAQDLHSLLETAREILDMALFGVLQHF